MKIETKIQKMLDLRTEIKSKAKGQYPEHDCPLRADHYDLSNLFFGVGYYKWKCGFCKKEDCDQMVDNNKIKRELFEEIKDKQLIHLCTGWCNQPLKSETVIHESVYFKFKLNVNIP